MTEYAPAAARRAWGAVPRAVAWLAEVRPARIVAAAIALQWLATLGLALVVRHNGWIYYQGGDQLWLYTLGWLLGHGQLTQTVVGYGWPSLLSPLAHVAGPNLASAMPVIALFEVLVLVPVAMAALYGIAARIGGRLFGYWALALWLVLPFVGVLYTNAGYHQRYTEELLPQAFGLTALSDLPTTVATLVSVYFCTRALFDERPQLVDALAAGVAAGAAIGIKPATSLFLLGPALAFLAARRFAIVGAFLVGIAPAVVTLAVWKERGLGNLPLLSLGDLHAHVRGLAAAAPLAGLDVGKYWRVLHWDQLGRNIDGLREHFWSGRLLVWMMLAGVVGLARRSPRAALLVAGWFFSFALVKGSYIQGSIEDGSLFRIMMPAYPAFLLLLASLPLLLPHVPARLPAWRPAFATPRARVRLSAIGVVVLVTAVLPLGAIAAADAGPSSDRVLIDGQMPIPSDVDIGLAARGTNGRVALTWRASRPAGGAVFYRVWRARTDGVTCPPQAGAPLCALAMPEAGVTRQPAFDDRPPGAGRWIYRVAVAVNWLDDPQYGDPYLVSRPVSVTVP